MRKFSSHGDGTFSRSDFGSIGENVIIENGVLVFNPKSISIGSNVYVGHNCMLKGYPTGRFLIGNDTWIGGYSTLHGAGGLTIGSRVGIGLNVHIITSEHDDDGSGGPLLAMPLKFAPVTIEDDCHIGASVTILPGVTIGRGAQVAAGAVVSSHVEPFSVVGGVPAKLIRMRR